MRHAYCRVQQERSSAGLRGLDGNQRAQRARPPAGSGPVRSGPARRVPPLDVGVVPQKQLHHGRVPRSRGLQQRRRVRVRCVYLVHRVAQPQQVFRHAARASPRRSVQQRTPAVGLLLRRGCH